MTVRTKVVMWIAGIILLFGLIFLAWAIDTNKLGIRAEADPQYQTASELETLPSPDQSIPSKIFTSIINLFR